VIATKKDDEARPVAKTETDKRPLSEEEEIEASAAPLLDHLNELRHRLIIAIGAIALGFVICFFLSRRIFDVLIIPFVSAVGQGKGEDATLYFAPLEFFFTQVRLAVFGGIVLAFPVIAYEAYKFIAPGLYRRERKAAAPFLIAAPVLFAAGAALVYFFMMPMVMRFAVGFEAGADGGAPANYQLFTKVSDYLNLITTLMLGFGFAFQLPVVLTLMASAGLVRASQLTKGRRYAIVLIFIVAAILTPPDPLSQIVLASFLFGLYEISIFAVRFAEKKAETEAALAAGE
jgi:sec-independent protein translocase protein TatC